MFCRLTVHFRAGVLCLLSVILPTSSGLAVRAAVASSSREAEPAEKASSSRDEQEGHKSKERGEAWAADACGHRDRPRTERRESPTSWQCDARHPAEIAGFGSDWELDWGVSSIVGALIIVGGGASDPREGLWAIGPPKVIVVR